MYRGFTLVEVMVVIAIIAIIAIAIYPKLTVYVTRSRDTVRIMDIKNLSANFQEYIHLNESYPSNTNKDGVISYCVSDIMLWSDATPQFKDKQYSALGWIKELRKDPNINNPPLGACGTSSGTNMTGSYFYAKVWKDTWYAVIAARMENQTTGANWSGAMQMTDPAYLDAMQDQKPLDHSWNDPDKIFLLITN